MDNSCPIIGLPDINGNNQDSEPLYDLIIVNFDPYNQDTTEEPLS